MKPWLKLFYILCCSCLLSAAGSLSAAEEQADGTADAKKQEADKAPDKAAKNLVLPIPVGHEVKGIRVPYFDVYGAKQLDFFAEQARRVDEKKIRMSDVEIEFFTDQGAPDMKVFLPVAIYNMDTQWLDSDKPVKITRSDFVITGDKLVFHLGDRQGTLTGSIKMHIFEKDNL